MTHRRRFAAALLGTLVTLATAAAQNAAPRPPTRSEILSAVKVIIADARYATLITLDDKGHPQARIVDPFAPEDDLTVWVATNARSRKVTQIDADARVTLSYFSAKSQGYVTLLATGQLVRDAREKARHWKQEWSAFYKDEHRGDDYVLIRVVPTRLEVVSTALGMINDPVTWRPVILDLP